MAIQVHQIKREKSKTKDQRSLTGLHQLDRVEEVRAVEAAEHVDDAAWQRSNISNDNF